MAELLSERCGVRVTIGNDAKCAANAELGFGSLRDIQDGAVVILGTSLITISHLMVIHLGMQVMESMDYYYISRKH